MTREAQAGRLLREWRQRRRLSQLDLAIAANVSSRHLSFIETGRARPTSEMILRLAELQHAVPQRLEQSPEEEEILGGQQVNGVAEQVGAHHGPFGQKVLKMLVTEAGQPRPQPDVRRERGLGLQRGQVLDRLPGGPGVPAQQQLAVQGGAVQGAGAELVGGHGRSAAAVGSSAG